MPKSEPKPRGVGRPRTRPEGVRECPVYLTGPEIAAVDKAAGKAGLSRAEWLRRLALGAVGLGPKK